MTDAAPTITIALAGGDDQAERWARAFRGASGVAVERIGGSDDDFLAMLARGDVVAVAFTAPMADLQGAIRRALISGRDVFVAGPVALASKQLLALDATARARRKLLVFNTNRLADERFAFIRKMTGGPNALWRPRYVRSLRTGAHAEATLDELAVADIGAVLEVTGGVPSAVSAVAPRVDDESGAADVAMVTMMFDGGSIGCVDVSLAEPELRQELTIACDGRTMVLDAYDLRAPLQIHAGARHRGPQRGGGQWSETVSEHPLAEMGDATARAAEAFIQALRANDARASNGSDIASAALVWETARTSIARGGEPVALALDDVPEEKRPTLKLIRGGGHSVATHPAPALTLVGAAEPESPRNTA